MPDLIAQLNEQKRKVDFDSFDITVKELISMAAEGLIDIAPEYQRQFRWDAENQSTFVESVFLGIPIPSLFMAANPDGTWELIDGVQRLSTLVHFVGDDQLRSSLGMKTKLTLVGLEKLSHFNAMSYDTLPRSVQIQFSLKPLKVTTISDKSDLQVRFDLFERLNTGGVLLTPQEIRACLYRGEFSDFLRGLSQDRNFKRMVKLPRERESDGTREEFVLRFFAFYYRYKQFEHSVVDFLNKYMADAAKHFNYTRGRALFESVFSALAAALPHGIVRERVKSRTPVNLYEAVAVGAALALKKVATLKTKGASSWLNSEELKSLTTGATNSRAMVQQRVEFCRDRFLGHDA